MIASTGRRARYLFSAVVVFGGGAVALTLLGWSLFGIARSHRDGLPAAPAGGDSVPAGPPANAILFDSVASVAAADMHDGVWFLLDNRISRVHRISGDGDQWSAFAGPGDGPGELRRPRALAVHGDTIVVAARRRLQFYRPDGTYVGGRRIEPPRMCRDTPLGDLAADLSDVASSPEGLLLLFTCKIGRARGGVFLETGEASCSPIVQDEAETDGGRLDLWRDMLVLVAHPSGFVFGHPEDDCIGLFDLGGERLGLFCHAQLGREPLPEAVTEQMPTEVSGSGAKVGIPDRYLPFDRVFVRSDGALSYRTPAPAVAPGLAEVQMSFRLAEFDGADWTTAPIPPAANVFVSGRAVLASWEDAGGTLIAFYTLDGAE